MNKLYAHVTSDVEVNSPRARTIAAAGLAAFAFTAALSCIHPMSWSPVGKADHARIVWQQNQHTPDLPALPSVPVPGRSA